jgi:ATP-dependent RNA helicase RhlE
VPKQSFADLGVSTPVAGALAARGFQSPFAVQRLIIPDALAGRDVLVKSPTGSGKTLAFGIPLADRLDANGPKQAALVLAPTRELATQIVDELYEIFHAKALAVAAVYGGAGIEKQARNARRAHVIVATPGRLEDLISRGDIRLDKVQILILDEADRMLDMGFRPVVDRIVRQIPRDRQTIFCSATLDGDAGKLAEAYTRNPARHAHDAPAQARGKVEHRFKKVAHEDKLSALVHELLDPDRGRTLVFVRTKRGADRLVKRLTREGLIAVAMHGDKSQSQREKALARFDRGELDILVATDVAARGIDVEHVSHVIQFDAPDDREGYIHRVGRTGRAGRSGVGITFLLAEQVHELGRIATELDLEDHWVRSGLAVPAARNEQRRPGPSPQQRSGRPQGGGSRNGRSSRPRRARASSSR